MSAISTEQPVGGTYQCFDRQLQTGLRNLGVDSDKAFATKVGQNGEYHFLRKTADGGYVYEYDRPLTPHDRLQGALNDLGWPRIESDIGRGDVGAAWHESNNFRAAWAEITGQTQQPRSTLFTLYMDGGGKVTAVK